MFGRLKQYAVDRMGVSGLADDIARVDEDRRQSHTVMMDLVAKVKALNDPLHRLDLRLATLETRERIVAATIWAAAAPLRHEPTISVVLATRNRQKLLEGAVDSVIAQTYPEWELIVIDDGSTDSSSIFLDKIAAADDRVRVERTDGVGAAAARNIGLTAATGDYIAFLDDDNLMAPGWLRAVAEFTGRTAGGGALYGVGLRDDYEDALGAPWVLFESQLDIDRLRLHNAIDLGVLVVRRDNPELHFDESLDRYIDWELVVRLAERGDLRPLPVVASIYTTRAEGRISESGDDEQLAAMQRRLAPPDEKQT
jgi:hypothetical protein